MFKSIFSRSADARSGERTPRPEEAVQSELGLDRHSKLSHVDYLGVMWLGEARWYYLKGIHYGFWGAAGLWCVVFLHPALPLAFLISTVTAFCFWMAIEYGVAVNEAFEEQRQLAEDNSREWQQEGVARRRVELKLHTRTPQWGIGEAEGDNSGETTPSADVLYTNFRRVH